MLKPRTKRSLAARIKYFGLIAAAVASTLGAANSAVQLWQNTDANTYVRRFVDGLMNRHPIQNVDSTDKPVESKRTSLESRE